MFDLKPFEDPFSLFNREIANLNKEFSNFVPKMKTDIKSDEKSYVVEAELPGFKKEEINIDFKDNVLSIVAVHNSEEKQPTETSDNSSSESKIVRKERNYSSVSRSFSFNEEVVSDAITAKYENGVLLVTLPKKEPSPVSKIDIE
jgi:HSP20 family protein